jgi:hypothetical protein
MARCLPTTIDSLRPLNSKIGRFSPLSLEVIAGRRRPDPATPLLDLLLPLSNLLLIGRLGMLFSCLRHPGQLGYQGLVGNHGRIGAT